ncbi:MAG: hypothetical protein DI562_00590 [Stenotrophomonas acidaminiphila]|nr:MAG: hypothetical protein DI562_00590 [Stenotrophomonas acidaminiphila]
MKRRPRSRGWSFSLMVLVLALTILGTVSCVPGKTYRTQLKTADYCVARDMRDCPRDALHLVAGAPQGVSSPLLGFVEFDDQGYLRESVLKDQLVRHLGSLAATRPLLIVVFTHGWKHNADPADGNVAAFSQLLLDLAAADAEGCANTPCQSREVVGVYLGWRGLSNRLEPFKTLSFWDRKGRAHRVGGDGVTEVLAELAKINAQDRESRLVIMGHSFGGAVVYNAVNQMLIRDTAFLNRDRVARNVADLIVLVNPAFEAARFNAIQRKASGFTFVPKQKPILAIFTSEADTATKRAFPAGRALSTLFSEHRDARQRSQNIRAIGHYAPFQTHTLTENKGAAATAGLGEFACAWQAYSRGDTDQWAVGPVALNRIAPPDSGSRRFNPYMVVRVEKGIISGHNDIWGEAFSDFVYRFVAVQDYRPCPSASPMEAALTETSPTEPAPTETKEVADERTARQP